MLKDNIPPITGIKNIFAIFVIIDDRNNEKELYVIANVGFFEAIIIEVIIGKYELMKTVDTFTPEITSVNILLIGTIISDNIINVVIILIKFVKLFVSFKNDKPVLTVIVEKNHVMTVHTYTFANRLANEITDGNAKLGFWIRTDAVTSLTVYNETAWANK